MFDLRVVGAVLFGLHCFGWVFDWWVNHQIEQGHHRGFMSFIVVMGVALTGVGYTVIVWSWAHGIVLMLCFVMSGIPMIVGSVGRYVRARARTEAESREQVKESFGDG